MKSILKFRYACTAKQVEQEGTKKMNEWGNLAKIIAIGYILQYNDKM